MALVTPREDHLGSYWIGYERGGGGRISHTGTREHHDTKISTVHSTTPDYRPGPATTPLHHHITSRDKTHSVFQFPFFLYNPKSKSPDTPPTQHLPTWRKKNTLSSQTTEPNFISPLSDIPLKTPKHAAHAQNKNK